MNVIWCLENGWSNYFLLNNEKKLLCKHLLGESYNLFLSLSPIPLNILSHFWSIMEIYHVFFGFTDVKNIWDNFLANKWYRVFMFDFFRHFDIIFFFLDHIVFLMVAFLTVIFWEVYISLFLYFYIWFQILYCIIMYKQCDECFLINCVWIRIFYLYYLHIHFCQITETNPLFIFSKLCTLSTIESFFVKIVSCSRWHC